MAKVRSKKPAQNTGEAAYIGATLTTSDTARRMTGHSPSDLAMVRRCCAQSLAIAVAFNAGNCAHQPLRLYRRAGAPQGKIYTGVMVKNRRQLAYLKGTHPAAIAGRKTAMMLAGEDGVEEVVDHPAIDLVRHPDPWQTGGDWMLLAFWFLEATGKSFTYKGDLGHGGPASLYHLFPQFTRPQGDRERMVSGYWYGRNTTDQRFYDASTVIFHKRIPSPQAPYLDAISWPQALQLESDLENNALQAETARWANGGYPGMVLTIDPSKYNMDVTARKQFEQSVAEQVRGVYKSGNVLTLYGAVPADLKQKPNEMGYLDGMNHLHAKILWAAGIPDSMAKMSSSSLANAYQSDPQYSARTINPRISKFAEDLTQGLLVDEYGLRDHFFAFDCPVADDRIALVSESVQLVTARIIKPEVAAVALGYEPDDVPEPMPTPTMTPDPAADPKDATDEPADEETPAEKAIKATGEAVAASLRAVGIADVVGTARISDGAACDGDGRSVVGAGDQSAPSRDSNTKELTHDCTVHTKDSFNPGGETGLALNAFVSRLQPWYQRAMSGGVNDGGAVNLAAFDAELHEIMQWAIPNIAAASARDAAKEVGGEPFDFLGNPRAVTWAKDNAAQAVVGITDTLKTELAERVAMGIASGQSVAKVQASIHEQAPEFSANRAETIARTETSAASNEGAMMAYKANGISRKDFELGSSPCLYCEAVKSQYPDGVGMQESWLVDGTPYERPPFHPNCVCSLVPVLDDGEGEG